MGLPQGGRQNVPTAEHRGECQRGSTWVDYGRSDGVDRILSATFFKMAAAGNPLDEALATPRTMAQMTK